MFFGKQNKIRLMKWLLLGAMLIAFTPGCSIQGYIAKKVAVHVGKKVYHGIKDQGEKNKERKAREKARQHVRDEEPE